MRILCVVLATVWCVACEQKSDTPGNVETSSDAAVVAVDAPARLENTLKNAATPYLRRSGTQAIPWLQWGPSVGKLARSTGKLLLVSVGADWCAGCRQMDETTYAHPATIKAILDGFIPVKVDADERSDVDARLQHMARVMADAAGYPLTMVISPDGVPLFATNALPPVVDGAVAPMADVLNRLSGDWRASAPGLLGSAQATTLVLMNAPPAKPPARADELWQGPLDAFGKDFDLEHGGMRSGPRIPTPRLYALAIHAGREWQDVQSLDRATHTLSLLCQRAIRDVVSGGFYRSARDPEWMRPAFDRHAADNALMLDALLDAHAATQSRQLKNCAHGILQFVADELLLQTELPGDKGVKSILFSSSIPPVAGNAQVGELQTFTTAEVQQALPAESARVAIEAFGMVPRPETVPGLPLRNIPYVTTKALSFTEDQLDAARRGLHQLRVQRGMPSADPVAYAAPTGMLVRAMLASAPALGIAAPRLLALEVLNAWMRHGYKRGGGFAHAIHPRSGPAGTGTLLDQAAMIRALTLAYEQTGEIAYLSTAVDTAEVVHRAFARPGGGYVDSIGEPWEPEVLRRRGSVAYDAELPSPGAEMALALIDLADVLGRQELRQRAGNLIQALAGDAMKSGPYSATLGMAAWRLTHPAIQVIVLDKQAGKGTVALTDAAQAPRRVGTAIQHVSQGGADGGGPQRPRAVVCVGNQCGKPTEDALAVRNDVSAARPPVP